MPETADLKTRIVQCAGELFERHGYAGTSIKQIASAAGCTSAALYYHFDSKSDLLSAVANGYSLDILDVVGGHEAHPDLPALLAHLGRSVGASMPAMAHRLHWLMLELPRLAPEERQAIHDHFGRLQATIAGRLARYLDPERAAELAWLFVCAYLGYGTLFLTVGYRREGAPDLAQFGSTIARALAAAP